MDPWVEGRGWWCVGGWFRSAAPDRRRPHPPGFRPLPLRPPSTPTTTTLIDFSITSRQFTIRAVSFRRGATGTPFIHLNPQPKRMRSAGGGRGCKVEETLFYLLHHGAKEKIVVVTAKIREQKIIIALRCFQN